VMLQARYVREPQIQLQRVFFFCEFQNFLRRHRSSSNALRSLSPWTLLRALLAYELKV
jgi:hypothetical protein